MMPADLTVSIRRFLGIDNVNNSQKTPSGTLSVASNVDINNDGSLSRRKGYTLKAAGNFHSLWANDLITLAVKDGRLVRIGSDYSTASVGDYRDITEIVYVDGKDGYVYCGSRGFLIRIDRTGTVYTPTALDSVEQKSYTQPQDKLYTIQTSGILQNEVITKRNKVNIGAATALEVYKGRLYAALDETVWISDAYDFMRILKLEKNFINFPSKVTAIAAMDNGVYISEEDKLWFLTGDGPDSFKFEVAYDTGITKNTSVRVDNMSLGDQIISPATIFTTNKGICVGTNDGSVINVTENKYTMPQFITGSSIWKRGEGLDQYLTIIES